MIDRLTRDSRLWNVVIAASLIIGALSVLGACDPNTVANCAADPKNLAYYGVPDGWLPYLRLAALISGTLAGVARTSPLAHSEYGKAKITPDDVKP